MKAAQFFKKPCNCGIVLSVAIKLKEEIRIGRLARCQVVGFEIGNSDGFKHGFIGKEAAGHFACGRGQDGVRGIGQNLRVRARPCSRPGIILRAAVSITVTGQSELTATPSSENSAARPRVTRLMPYFEMV